MLWTGPILEREVVWTCCVHTDVPTGVLMGVPMVVGRPDAPQQETEIREC